MTADTSVEKLERSSSPAPRPRKLTAQPPCRGVLSRSHDPSLFKPGEPNNKSFTRYSYDDHDSSPSAWRGHPGRPRIPLSFLSQAAPLSPPGAALSPDVSSARSPNRLFPTYQDNILDSTGSSKGSFRHGSRRTSHSRRSRSGESFDWGPVSESLENIFNNLTPTDQGLLAHARRSTESRRSESRRSSQADGVDFPWASVSESLEKVFQNLSARTFEGTDSSSPPSLLREDPNLTVDSHPCTSPPISRLDSQAIPDLQRRMDSPEGPILSSVVPTPPKFNTPSPPPRPAAPHAAPTPPPRGTAPNIRVRAKPSLHCHRGGSPPDVPPIAEYVVGSIDTSVPLHKSRSVGHSHAGKSPRDLESMASSWSHPQTKNGSNSLRLSIDEQFSARLKNVALDWATSQQFQAEESCSRVFLMQAEELERRAVMYFEEEEWTRHHALVIERAWIMHRFRQLPITYRVAATRDFERRLRALHLTGSGENLGERHPSTILHMYHLLQRCRAHRDYAFLPQTRSRSPNSGSFSLSTEHVTFGPMTRIGEF